VTTLHLIENSFAVSVAGVKARINYAQWLKKTAIAHHVTLEGWPMAVDYNPKKKQGSVLVEVCEGLINKRIRYRKMTEEELEAAHAQIDAEARA
jgi:hypothetical protein